MNAELIKEWSIKAKEDLETAELLYKARKSPANLGFHCQQTIEKLLKAFLLKQASIPPRKHDLVELIELAIPFDTSLQAFKQLAREVNPYAVIVRYPGDERVTFTEAKNIYKKTKEFYAHLIKII